MGKKIVVLDTKQSLLFDHRDPEPRFSADNLRHDMVLVELVKSWAQRKEATPAQIALAWVLAQKPWIAPIPGTTKLHRLEENLGGATVELTADDLRELNDLTSQIKVQGARYGEGSQKLVNR